ncbi:MAG: type II secretion system F family protein [Candidatus Woesearchaeota archaeon]
MKFKQQYLIGISIGSVLFLIDVIFFLRTRWFMPLFIVSFSIALLQIWLDFFIENQKQKEIESRFLDFVRNLTGAIKSGMPVAKAIIHISKIDYGALSPYVRKLGHQLEWNVPVHKALILFSKNTKNEVIKRSIATVIEAEQAGGNMEDVLASITNSLIEIKKIKEERRASIHSQIMQSYVIFLIFIGVMLVIQNMLVPYLMGNSQEGIYSGLNLQGNPMTFSQQRQQTLVLETELKFNSMSAFVYSLGQWFVSLRGIFLMLTLIQAFFAGVIIGKMAEGDLTSGLKHSLILMLISFFIMTLFKP